MDKKEHNPKKLEQLAQNMFNRGREDIESEIHTKLVEKINYFNRRGTLESGMFVDEAIKLHTERIEKFLTLRLSIDKEVFFDNQPIKTNEDVDFIMKNLKEIAEPQKSVVFSEVESIIDQRIRAGHFKNSIERNVAIFLSKIKRDLIIEKDKQILLVKKEVEQIGSKIEEIQKFEALLKSIENEILREILVRDFSQAIFCLKNELWKPCVVLCGGILEGVFNIEFGMDKAKKGGKPREMSLEDMIDTAKNIGILPKKHDVDLAHAVRAFRNYVHIKREIKDERSIDDTDAHISLNVVKKIFRMIEKFKEEQKKVQK